MAEGDVEFGHVVDLTLGELSGTELVADAAIGATTLTVDYAGDFEDVGEVVLNGATLAYTEITYGAAEADPDVITLAAPLAAAAVVDDKVVRVSGGEPLSDWLLHVSLGDGHPVDIPIPFEQRALWSSVDTSTPVPVMVSADLERLVEVPGRTPELDLSYADASTLDVTALPPIPATDGDAPTAATTVTPIGGIGSMFYRWTEITNNDPVTYRLHVRAGSAPTTTGTYEVAAGVGLTSAAVRKLKDGTAIVGDGSVTYHAIVTVEDADGPGPASTDVTGIPAQITSPDIATGAVTTDTLVFNSGWGAELNGETINGVTITGTTITGLSDFFAGPTGTSRVSIRADYGPLDDPGIVFEIAGDASDLPPFISGGFATGIGNFVTVSAGSFDRTTEPVPSYTVTRDTLSGVGLHQFLDAAVRIGADGLEVQGPLTADTVNIIGSIGTGSVGTGTFRDSVRAAVTGNYAAAWTTYTPTFTAATTNPTLANFTRAGRYLQVGKRVNFSIVITATAASGYGTGTYEFGLPVTARATDEVVVTAAQSGPNHGYIGRTIGGSTTAVSLLLSSTDAAINPTNSGMTTGTVLRITGTYEAA